MVILELLIFKTRASLLPRRDAIYRLEHVVSERLPSWSSAERALVVQGVCAFVMGVSPLHPPASVNAFLSHVQAREIVLEVCSRMHKREDGVSLDRSDSTLRVLRKQYVLQAQGLL